MARTLTLFGLLVLIVAGAAVVLVATVEPPVPPATAAVAPAGSGPAPALDLAAAMREMDLIRPARVKLADDFTVPTPEGGVVRLGQFRGQTVFLNFWATWCPPCREEMPGMERLYQAHRSNGFMVLAVSVDADPAKVPAFVREHGLTFPIGLDPGMKVADQYGVRALPSSFLIDADGHLAGMAIGPRVWDGEAAHALVRGLRR